MYGGGKRDEEETQNFHYQIREKISEIEKINIARKMRKIITFGCCCLRCSIDEGELAREIQEIHKKILILLHHFRVREFLLGTRTKQRFVARKAYQNSFVFNGETELLA